MPSRDKNQPGSVPSSGHRKTPPASVPDRLLPPDPKAPPRPTVPGPTCGTLPPAFPGVIRLLGSWGRIGR